MSVKTLISNPEVRERLDSVTPILDRLPTLRLKVPPLTSHYTLVGTAFDYALRFELQRRNPHAVARAWVADAAVSRVPKAASMAALSKKDGCRLKELAEKHVLEAKVFWGEYVAETETTRADHEILAKHAILLAKLDFVFRAYRLDPELGEVDSADVQDVASLLQIAPYEALSHPKIMLLNPTFGVYSEVAGGADADLITGNCLVDFKTTKAPELGRESIRQLVAYFMLGCRAKGEDQTFPAIERLGIYFSRQGHLWEIPTNGIVTHPGYPRTENWFIRHAIRTEMDPLLRELWDGGKQLHSKPRLPDGRAKQEVTNSKTSKKGARGF